MPISKRWLAPIALLLAVALPGCDSAEEPVKNDVEADIDSLVGDNSGNDFSEIDLDKAMSAEFRKKKQALLKEAKATEAVYAERFSDWKPDLFMQPTSLTDQSKREEFKLIIEEFSVAMEEYKADSNLYWDKVHTAVIVESGDGSPDSNYQLRIGLKALVDASIHYANAHLEVVEFCEIKNATVGSDGLVDFKRDGDDDEFLKLTFAITEAEDDMQAKATIFQQMRQQTQ